jgi:hypothetical protein
MRIKILFCLLVSCVFTGCLFPKESQPHATAKSTASHRNWREIELSSIAGLVIGETSDGGKTYRKVLNVGDREFVQTLFADLMAREPSPATMYAGLIEPKALVFVDDHGNILASFIYRAAGDPEHIFRPANIVATDDVYRVESLHSRSEIVTLPDFGQRARRYLDVWK